MTSKILWPWPLHPTDNLEKLNSLPGYQKHHKAGGCFGCVLSREEIDDEWKRGIVKSLKGWADNNAKELPGVGEEEVQDFFDEDGLDEYGFNEEGYNSDGIHYLDYKEDEQQNPNEIPDVIAWRLVIQDILDHIPRYENAAVRKKIEKAARRSNVVLGKVFAFPSIENN
jgi:hypothetical protein